jgi:diguanylate cyclase (GGDEF)-like protein
MARKSTIKLLLINESDNEGERLISLFRNAGRVARAQRAQSVEDLYSLLENDPWDLVIANDKHPEIDIDQCLAQLKKQKIDTPIIVIRDSDAEAALTAGASDVIKSEDNQRLIFAAFRELRHLDDRRLVATLKEKLADAEERSDQLMSQSQDAIAYVSDGMLIKSNSLFCSRFGYEDPDDLDCAPIIDLISKGDHEQFKIRLKAQDNDEQSNTNLNFSGISQTGDKFSATMQLNNTVLDNEPCIQLIVREQDQANHNNVNMNYDTATGLYSYDYFLSKLDSCGKQAAAGTHIASLLYIGIDKFNNFRSRCGINHSYEVMLGIAAFIKSKSKDSHCLAHFCDDGFTMLLQDFGADKAHQYAEKLCRDIEEHIIEVDGQSIQCTVSIGLVVVDNQQQGEPHILIDQAFGACENIREKAENEGIGNGVEFFVAVRENKSLGDANGDDELDSFLEEAIEDNLFTLRYQPVVSLRGNSGDHYEVSTIMINEQGEKLAARDFLGNINFKETNTRLDRWILLEATKKLAAQIENGNNVSLIINLTANSLQDESLIPWLTIAIKAGDLPAEAIVFQFSESDISDFLKPAKLFSEAIKNIGCKISITDFGQSDDPFKALNHIKAEYAKISIGFADALKNTDDTQALKAIVSSIKENETQAIISGVENAAALAQLWPLGVDYIQGSYLADPSEEMDYEFTDIA